MTTKTTSIFIEKLDTNKDLYLDITTKKGSTTVMTYKLDTSDSFVKKTFNISGGDGRRYTNNIKRATDKSLQAEHQAFLKKYAEMEELYSKVVKTLFIKEEMEKLSLELSTKNQNESRSIKI